MPLPTASSGLGDRSAERAARIAADLDHPFAFHRKTDPQLAAAVEAGHLGLRRSAPGGQTTTGSLSEGHEEALMRDRWAPDLLRTQRYARLARRAAAIRTHRRWPLRRSEQADQGERPICVAATQKNWEVSRPVEWRKGLGMEEMYRRCKQIDGWPTEDGTTSDAMVNVCTELDLIEQAYRFSPTDSPDAVVRWLLDVSSLWWGSNWPESAFRTRLDPRGIESGLVDPRAPFRWGHEVLIIGYGPYKRNGNAFEVVNWPQWGIQGRGFILEADFWTWMDEGQGDLVGVLEKRHG